MTPGACAFVAGAQVHAPVRVRLLHTSVVNAVTVALVAVAGGRSGTEASGAAGAAFGGVTLSGADEGVAAAVAGAAGSGWGAGVGSAGAAVGAGVGDALADADGDDAARSREFELIRYHPAASSTASSASTAAIAGTRDGSRVAAGALSVLGVTGTADEERSGRSPSDGGAADRGDRGAAFFGAAGGIFGGAGDGGGAGRGGGADDAAGANADNAFGAGDVATGDVSFGSFGDAAFKGMLRAVQNCSRFSRLVVTNGSFAGKLDVAMANARR